MIGSVANRHEMLVWHCWPTKYTTSNSISCFDDGISKLCWNMKHREFRIELAVELQRYLESLKEKQMKKCLCLFILSLMVSSLFATSRPVEVFAIRNNSSSDVFVNIKFWYGPGSNLASETRWHQTISGIRLSILDSLALGGTNIIRPNQEIGIIDFNAGFGYFDKMVAIPIMDKLNAIFKRFEIIRYDGKTIMTLEDIKEFELEKTIPWRGFVLYMLQIFDCNMGTQE